MVKIKMLRNYRNTYLQSEVIYESEEKARELVRAGYAELINKPIKKGYKTK